MHVTERLFVLLGIRALFHVAKVNMQAHRHRHPHAKTFLNKELVCYGVQLW